MAPIAWKPEYSVGDPAVDHEHQELVELVNSAAAAILDGRPGADIDRSFGDLFRAISAHFAHEEKQMRRAEYDQYPPHKADHERLLDALRDIMDDAHDDAEAAAERLTAALEAWFVEHFRTHDARLHRKLGPHDH
ncbi:hemerythrin family protein [Defluviimonas sp. D31]|uniref:Hemerythrin family protein n=1 Tax=Defluviimonas salinarum TaxID=2992147 RepID=A0ABT3J149_9RHOB|nr:MULTISPECIES: hemerythrin family protein [Defluviimonas]MCW3781165.1 hemerythrin family protein [Defluviimonas salinarum]MDW4547807.1 hemerythrin family protein [Defluviimonas sp. D31]